MSEEERNINTRFLDAYHVLKRRKEVKNKSDFSSRLDMPLPYFSFFEKEERHVPPQYLDKICKEFNISKAWLIHGTGEIFNEETQTASNRITGNHNSGNQWSGHTLAYGTGGECEQQLAVALKEIEGLREQVALYKQMVEMLKGK
jgi:hypothetical protein